MLFYDEILPRIVMTKKIFTIFFVCLVAIHLSGCSTKKETEGRIVISGKRFTEQIILAHLLGEYLKAKTTLDVKVKSNLGGIYILTEALKQKEIDMYVEYTGTGYLNVLKEKYTPSLTAEDIYSRTKKGYEERFNVTWLKPLGFDNTYAMAVKEANAHKLNLKTISDMAKLAPQFTLGSDAEFLERPDGYRGLEDTYHLGFKRKMSLSPDLMYQAVYKGQVDVIASYSTDPRIEQLKLHLLEDDQHFFPPYAAVPIVRKEVLAANPSLEKIINQLGGKITDSKIRYLNGQVNIHHKRPKDVAREFLKQEGLI